MRSVLFNDLILLRQRSGIGHYAAQLLHHLPKVAPDLSITLLSGLPRMRWVASWIARSSKGSSSGGSDSEKAFLQAALDRYLSWAVRRGDWGILHEPDSIACQTQVPTLVSVMDLSVTLFPHWHPAHRVKKYETYFMRSLKQSAFFVAISEATKRDMVEHLKVKADQIAAIPLAPRPEFHRISEHAVGQVKQNWKLPVNYFLFVGNLDPRKNLPGLLRAYSRLPGSLRAQFPLVLVGAMGWKAEDLQAMLARSPWRETVRHLGYLPDADLVAVTQGATAMIYPSFYEGFGLPPLEAMACGTPVISSAAGGLAETIGNAARIIDPEDELAMAGAMKEVAQSEELRRELSKKGLVQAGSFSWEATARATAQVYHSLLR